jgi:hypothetical protein
MTGTTSTRFTDDRTEYDQRHESGEHLTYTAALHLPIRVRPLCERLQQLAATANAVNVLNPLSSYRRLSRVRRELESCSTEYHASTRDCLTRLAEPVEGTTAADLAWIQGFTMANGIAALMELNSTFSSVAEALDRKSAYSMACFSLYVAVVSLSATVILGLLSIQ